jgi:cob(I)alamin adenosyltransferase
MSPGLSLAAPSAARWAAIEQHGESVNVLAAKYLNRLSDLLFILARHANRERGDVLWQPGGGHVH